METWDLEKMHEEIVFEGLNTPQKQAITAINGPLLVLAGAGSGKTRVVTFRIAHMIAQGIDPSSILGLTFTNKAANEMLERVRKLTDCYVRISTFHSLGAYILRESIEELGYPKHFTIYDEEDALKLIRACVKEAGFGAIKLQMKGIKAAISKRKNAFLPMEDFVAEENEAGSIEEQVALKIAAMYQAKLKNSAALDFDDLLYLPVKLFQTRQDVLDQYRNAWKYLLIDEYQDTNQVQNQLVELLIGHTKNLCVVGDPDQSIYSWRGAKISYILDFQQKYSDAVTVHLGQNYRSRPNILQAASSLISNNSLRLKKEIWSEKEVGEKIERVLCQTEASEAKYVAKKLLEQTNKLSIPLKECAVLYRTNGQSRVLEDAFLAARIPYQIIGGTSFYQRREIKDVLSYLKLLVSQNDILAFERSIAIPKRGIGAQTLDKLFRISEKLRMPLLTYCQMLIEGIPLDEEVSLSTKQKNSLAGYLNTIEVLQELLNKEPLEEVVRAVIQKTGYLNALREDQETFEDRAANLDALIGKAMEWRKVHENPTLITFLEELSLRASIDESDGSLDCVHLMTLHNSKGLEYALIFLVGVEEGLFPHMNSLASASAIEEERRLCYVGMTRAKEMLYLSHALERFIFGGYRNQRPSRFLREIDDALLKKVQAPL
jgi:DNA helicase II / ATP-dependent DNA helicase PcrA